MWSAGALTMSIQSATYNRAGRRIRQEMTDSHDEASRLAIALSFEYTRLLRAKDACAPSAIALEIA
jgi:hypothetical protein